jgi:23S rRNA pseudouridine955/2504/2580 synthase
MEIREKELITGIDDAGRRLDRILRRALPDVPLSGIHRLLRKGRVTVDGLPTGAAVKVKAFSRIRIVEGSGKPGAGGSPAGVGGTAVSAHETPTGAGSLAVDTGEPSAGDDRARTAYPESGLEKPPDLAILWEGAGLIILNKPAGLAVHGSGGDGQDNLNVRLQAYLRGRLPPSLSFRPGPLHRLDQVSSGVIVFSLSLEGARSFSALMRERRLRKWYLALADGVLTEAAVWEDALFRDKELGKTFSALQDSAAGNGAQSALTRVFPLAIKAPYSFIALEIETGRTHQIRAQAALHGHPLAGDRTYGGSHLRGGLLLHAFSLEFPPDAEILPPELRGKSISAPLPERFARQIGVIFGLKNFFDLAVKLQKL